MSRVKPVSSLQYWWSNRLPVEALRNLASSPVMIVDTGAIQRNFKLLSSMTRGTCAAVVKGDGYGHGMLASSNALATQGAQLFFTARFSDALTLKSELDSAHEVAVLDGVSSQDIDEAVHHRITPVINSIKQLELVSSAATKINKRLDAYLHLDTAMNRLGLAPEDDGYARELLSSINVKAYMTHFTSADDIDLDMCQLQVERLKTRTRALPAAPLSIANSCGAFLNTEFHGDIIRPGKSTFGINPLSDAHNPMEEPATVLAPIVQIRNLAKGDPVGYSCTWRAPDHRRVAILAIGYANGFLRSNSNLGCVEIEGYLAPIVGRVSMDLTAVDISNIPDEILAGSPPAIIVGGQINYRQLAQSSGTNEHETIIALGKGCRRYHVKTTVET